MVTKQAIVCLLFFYFVIQLVLCMPPREFGYGPRSGQMLELDEDNYEEVGRSKRDESDKSEDSGASPHKRLPLLFKRETNIRKPLIFKRYTDQEELSKSWYNPERISY